MARAATTTDAFNAVAEPSRRQILDILAGGERPVNDLVRLLGLSQPQVSKHLRVLREVGAVDVRNEGRQRLYRLNGHALKPIHDWVKKYERSWSERFDRMEGGFFLIQRVDLEQYGQRIKGIEIIGHERPFGADPSEEIKSRFYSNTGDTLDNVYELQGDTLTIWGGVRGSPAYYRGTFSDEGDTLSGAWHYPGGGGYEATSTRVR